MTKIAAVTGGAQGIGKAIALAFASTGYKVYIADIDQEAGDETVAEIEDLGAQGFYMPVNVRDTEAVNRWFQRMENQDGHLDALVNNAGIMRIAPALDLPLADFDEVLGVNLRGTFYCSQLAGRLMKQQGHGAIVNIASTRALMSEANTEAYSASKGGILALTHAMAVSLGPFGVRVNAISPGWIETGEWQKSSARRKVNHSERDRLQHPVGRVGVPQDIAEACLYLCDERAGFITGQNLVIDGGMTVKMIYEE